MTSLIACGLLVSVAPLAANIASHPDKVSDAELFASLDLARPGLEPVRDAVAAKDYRAAGEAWTAYFRRRETPTPHFHRKTWGPFVRKHYPQLVGPILDAADKIVARQIGHPPFKLIIEGDDIRWLKNPTKDTNYISAVGSQWFMNALGRAYLLTGDEKYARTFAWLFESWYDHVPEIRRFACGLNIDPVFRAYYPGIRARILVENAYAMAQSDALTPAVHVKIMKHLLGCACWLAAHETRYRPGNQQVGAVVGLGAIGMVFPEFKQADAWTAKAQTLMQQHLAKDFFPDGGHMELCTQYHKTVLRDVGYVALIAEANGHRWLSRDEVRAHAERAYDWLAKIITPTGHTPPLHSAVFATDYAVHLMIAARTFRRPDMLWLAQRFWQRGRAPNQKGPFGLANYLVCELLDPTELGGVQATKPTYESVHLDTSGFAIMRSGWQPTDDYLMFQYGWSNSGHAYPAALSFLLMLDGELVATHPGSPLSYRHPAYRYCHSTAAHNVVTIDLANTKGKGRFAPGGKLNTHADLDSAWYVRATHDGYKPAFGAGHERRILAIKGGPVFVLDRLSGGTGHKAYWSLHTPLEPTIGDDRTATLKGRREVRIMPAWAGEIEDVKVERHWMAVLPGSCQPEDCGQVVPVIRYVKPIGASGARFCVVVADGAGRCVPLSDDAVRLDLGGTSFVVLWGDGERELRAGKIVARAECACVRYRDDRPERAWLIRGRRLDVGGASWWSSLQSKDADVNAP